MSALPPKPIILVVDDDLRVRRAVVRDLKRRYGKDYRVLQAASAESALKRLAGWQKRKEPVALVIAEQRLPPASGVEFMKQVAQARFCETRRMLFTEQDDGDALLRAMDDGTIDFHLLKSADPPEAQFFPLVDDLLGAWKSATCSPFAGIRVIGHRWSAASHAVKDFLARNQQSYRWLDIENRGARAEARRLLQSCGLDDARLPVIVLADGSCLVEPSPEEIAERVGLHTHAAQPFYDLVIVGAGPAGLTAAVYGASEGLSTVMIEREGPGGQAGTSSRIENYLGFPAGLSGADLARRAVEQAKRFGVEILSPQEVTSVRVDGQYRIAVLADGTELRAHALVLATGVAWRKLDAPGVDELTGCGVYYGAAMTEALSCKDDDVFVVGGANSAGQAAMYFSRYARCVTLLVRGESLSKSMSQYLIDEIEHTSNIRVRPCCEVIEAHGTDNLERLTLCNAVTKETEIVPAAALFLCIGAEPNTEWLGDLVARDAHGFILSGAQMLDSIGKDRWPLEREPFFFETSTPGIFVAGDVWNGPAKRVAAAVGQGAVAVQFIHQYLASVK